MGRECLRGGDTDFRSRFRIQDRIRLPRQARFAHIADGQYGAVAVGTQVPDRRQGVRRFPALGYGHHGCIGPHHRRPIPKLGGNLCPGTHAGTGLEPVAGNLSGVGTGPASQNEDFLNPCPGLFQARCDIRQPPLGVLNPAFQGLRHRRRLLEDFLLHEMAVAAALHLICPDMGSAGRPVLGVARLVRNLDPGPGQLREIPFRQIHHLLRKRGQGRRVRCQEGFPDPQSYQ